MKVLFIYSGKGGVGKTTTTVNTAKMLSEQGKKVYIIDGDVNTSSVHVLLGMQQDYSDNLRFNSIALFSDGLIYIQASMIRKFISDTIKDIKKYKPDYVLIDTPPSITDVHINLIDRLKVSGVLMVTQPNALSVEDVAKTAGFFEINNIPVIGLVENMVGEYFSDGTDTSRLGFNTIASIPLDKNIAQGTDLSLYQPITEAIINADDVVLENKKRAALCDDSITEQTIEATFNKHRASSKGKPLDVLKFYNIATWEYVTDKIEEVSPFQHDKFLTENTAENIGRLLKAFEDDDQAYFMVTKGNNFPEMTIFTGEIGQATLLMNEKSYYGIPRIKYQTQFGECTLFPHEVMPMPLEEINQMVSQEDYKPMNDRRYMPPKEAINELYHAFGSRVGIQSNWEEQYDKQMA
jgi:MinD-like ATPase involved in chromosome partitioning or flagellar assembly